MTERSQRLALVVSEYAYFRSHRLDLARAAQAAGYDVHVITRLPGEAASVPGITLHHLPFARGGGNPLVEARLTLFLSRLFRQIGPGIVNNVSVRLAPAGSLAAGMARVPVIINAYTGLGFLFRGGGARAALLRSAVQPVLWWAARRRGCWSVFQNEADLDEFRQRGLIDQERTLIIAGSGVDTGAFTPVPEPEGAPLVLFAGRLLRDKGIVEFVEAARLLAARGVPARFAAAGDPDRENPSSVTPADLAAWRRDAPVEWWGQCDDMAAAYREAAVVCLPSHHEGLPKVLLETGASGRAAVASDIPGCRAVIRPGENGLLVPPKDPQALADALEKLILNKELRDTLGREARRVVEQRFAAPRIAGEFLALYGRALRGGGMQADG